MLTFAVMVWWFGLTISAAAIVGASLAQNAVSLCTRAVRGWMRGRMGAGLSADGDGIEGIEEGPRRSLFSKRNRFRPGVLGNMMLRSGALRRVA
jgi:hypothetical protein